MAKRREQHDESAGAKPADSSAATAELPPPADPQPNGDPVHPAQPAKTPRRPRDPNAPRPLYLLVALDDTTGRLRLLGTAPTVGQASKLVPSMSYGIERGESGPVILRAKIVSAVGRRTRKAS